MYGKLNTDEYENGQHLWYETCFGRGKCIVVVDKQEFYNVRHISSEPHKHLSKYAMIQCIDISEVFPITEDSHPEKYFIQGVR